VLYINDQELAAAAPLAFFADRLVKLESYLQGDDNYFDTNGEYLNSEGKVFDLNVQNYDPEVDFAIMELHEITTEGGNNKWNKAPCQYLKIKGEQFSC
jgi:hypothetical protein